MSKQSSTHTGILLENMSVSIDKYKVSKDVKYIEKIKKYLMDALDVEYVTLWQYDVEKKSICALEKIPKRLQIEKSLMKGIINHQRPRIENHVVSHKIYRPFIDNPFNYPLKAMIFYPLIEKNNVQGILVLAKGRGQKKLFEREELYRIEKFQTVLLEFVNSYDSTLPEKPSSVVVDKDENTHVEIKAKRTQGAKVHTIVVFFNECPNFAACKIAFP